MSQVVPERKEVSITPLRGAVLALILDETEQPPSGYKLGTMLERRLRPVWQSAGSTGPQIRQSVYRALAYLESTGLIVGSSKPSTASREGQKTYVAGPAAEAEVASWIASPVPKEPKLEDLQARIVACRERDAPLLLSALAAYERQCYAAVAMRTGSDTSPRTWRGLTMNVSEKSDAIGVRAQLQWVSETRALIEDFLTAQKELSR